MEKREQILAALAAFVRQRPGLEPGNYFGSGDWAQDRRNYDTERRAIHRDRRDAERLLARFGVRSIPEATLREAFRAYSGRLKLTDTESGDVSLNYCTGQYFPTEYRKAVCAVLAQALWDHWREDYAASAKRCRRHRARIGNGDGLPFHRDCGECESAGDAIRRNFRRVFGARFARRWFDA